MKPGLDTIKLLKEAVLALENQRSALGEDLVDAALDALHEKIAALELAKEPAKRVRKQVSVLFADISGFTSLSEQMDAEEVSDLINSLWKHIDQKILDHGGLIDKHIGDAVMALWGSETAREDDPEQAVLAALEIQALLAAGLPAKEDKRAAQLQLRIAVHTGPVFLGAAGITGEFTAIGDTVNTSSRLQHHAPLGGVVISHVTDSQVRGLFETVALPAIPVKGKQEPLQAFQVLRALPRAFKMLNRGVEGISTRMVGRDAELARLRSILEETLQGPRCRMVTLEGQAGVGKSRLQGEFESAALAKVAELKIFRGRATQDSGNRPYALLRDMFAADLHIQESDSLAVVWQKLEQGFDDQMRAHFIGQVLGYDFSASPHLKNSLHDARQLHNRAVAYISSFLRTTSRSRPVLIFLDDVHWSDDSSLEVLETLFRTLSRNAVMFVCMARSSLFDRRPTWGSRPDQSLIKLEPLSRSASQALLEDIFQKLDEIPAELESLILNNADGNPYYIEELVRMLSEEGVIVPRADKWIINLERQKAVRIPATLTGILQARLDSLPPDERKTLQCSAVVGRIFWDGAVGSLQTELPGILEKKLDDLQNRELVFSQAASVFAGSREFSFNHGILRDVTYESVLMRDRRNYHAQVAYWLIGQSGQRVNEYSGTIAGHLEQAGETVQAIHYLRLATEQARQTFANREACSYLTRTLELLEPEAISERFDLVLTREALEDLQGDRVAQARDIVLLSDYAVRLGGTCAINAALRSANYKFVTGDFAAAGEKAREAADLALAAGERSLQASALVILGQSLSRIGAPDKARDPLNHALALAQTTGANQAYADALRLLGNLAYNQSEYEEAESYFNESLRLCRHIHDRAGESSVHNSLGMLYRSRGDDARSQASYLLALQIAQEIGDRRMEGATLVNLGVWYRNRGDYPPAIDSYQKALSIQREIEDPAQESATLINLAIAFQTQGRLSAALQHYHQAFEIKGRIGDKRGISIALSGLGSIELVLGRYDEAQRHLEEALKLKQALGDKRGEIIVLESLSVHARKTRDYALGLDYARQSLDLSTKLGQASLEAHGHYEIALCLARLEDWTAALESQQRALEIWMGLGDADRVLESRAALSAVLLALGRTGEASEQVELSMKSIDATGSSANAHLNDVSEILFIAYKVRLAAGDDRAADTLTRAYKTVQDHAALLEDPELHRSFLEDIDGHAEIIARYLSSGGPLLNHRLDDRETLAARK